MPESRPKGRYVAILVFESQIVGVWSDPKCDVQYRLIRAADSETAYQRAQALGRRDELRYTTVEGRECVWSFKGLEDLDEVLDDEIGHGTELYGFIETGEAEDRVRDKADLTQFRERAPDSAADGDTVS